MADPRWILRALSGAYEGRTLPLELDKPLLVGRSRGDVVLDDPLVSGAHCRIVSRRGRFVVQDLGSTNGTSVDGRRVQDATLEAGMELAVGSTRFLVTVVPAAEPKAPPTRAPSTSPVAALASPEMPSASDVVAWLCADELDIQHSSSTKLLGQALHIPLGLNGVLEVVSGPDQGRRFPLGPGTMTIGRKAGDVPLNDAEVSRKHACVDLFGHDMVFLRDLGSTNGTFHNGRRQRMVRLNVGDHIGVGRTILTLKLEEFS